MGLTALDWAIVAAYFALSAAVGVRFARRAGQGPSEFFAAGRALPWWLAGTSMVATTFAADTPLVVTGLVARNGVAGNWVWWNMVMGGILTVFFYARLWRRAGVTTDAELIELRYSGRPAAVLRAFRALYLALPINLIIMGWVNLAMVRILSVTFGVHPFAGMLVLFAVTVAYSVTSGLWGVVLTDLVQFVIAMAGCIVLAVFAVRAVGGTAALVARVPPGSLELWPGAHAAWMPASAFLAYLTVQWWAAWYPGAEPGGGGYIAQRIFSARSERDGLLATLWFNIAHYAVRPWPWILVALASLVLYPGLAQPELGYVKAVNDLLPSGLRGLMLAAFFAAYMSTISTQLNWGASYAVNDVYVRFINPQASPRQVVRVSRAATAVLFALSALATWALDRVGSIDSAWRILIALGAGTGAVYLLRWYWWRINAWSEISAMAASLVAFVGLTAGGVFDPEDPLGGAQLMLATCALTTFAWVLVTFLTPPTGEATLRAFHDKVRPGGPGWRRFGDLPLEGGARALVSWLCGVISVYAALFGVGKLILGPRLQGAALLAAGAAAFAVIAWNLRRSAGETA